MSEPLPETMRAAIQREAGAPLAIETVKRPAPGAGEVLIKVAACGVCHSDLHAVDGDWTPAPNYPLIPGHEVIGRVAAQGPGVSAPALGALVGVPWMYSACGRCRYCLAGMESICPSAEATGYTKPGGYAEYMIAPAEFVARLPDDADIVPLAPILCAGVTTYRGLKRSGARPGEWIAILGIGGLGHVAVQYARAMGLRVAAIDVDPDKLDLARTLGAEVTLDARAEDPVATLQARLGGVQAALVTAVATRAFEQAVAMLAPAGTAVYVGLPGGSADEVRLSIGAVANWERTVRGSNIGTRLDLAEAVDFAIRGLVEARVTTARLEDAPSVLDAMRAGRVLGRTVLVFD